MVVFEKNGQGKFDFDYVVLEEMTSKEFAKDVEWLLGNHPEYIYEVQLHVSDVAITVSWVEVGALQSLSYFKKDAKIIHNYMNISFVLSHFPAMRERFNELGGW